MEGNSILLRTRFRSIKDESARFIFLLCASLSIITTFGIVFVLVFDAFDFFSQVSIIEFFTSSRWSPTIKPAEFGVLPLISGTLIFTFVSALIALPVGLAAAIYLSEYAGERVRSWIKPALEILAGIPTVVYGYFALVYITPLLAYVIPGISTFNILSAGIVGGIMIIPIVSSISEDSLRAVPKSLREAGYGLGADKLHVTTSIVVPAALSGVISSFILGISRAVGETMAVTIAAGNLARVINPLDLSSTFLKPVQTMTAAMVEIGLSDVTGDSVAYKSLFAVGLTLFAMTFALNVFSQYIKSRYREVYE